MKKNKHCSAALFWVSLILCLFLGGMEAEAVSGVSQTKFAEKYANLEWQKQEGEASYEIYVWMPSSSWEGDTLFTDYSLEFLGETTSQSYKINGLKGGYQYNAIIRAYDAEGNFLSDTKYSFETAPAKEEDIKTSLKWSSYTTKSVGSSKTKKNLTYNLYIDITSQESADGYEIYLKDCKKEKDKYNYRSVRVKAKSGSSVQRYTFNNLKDSVYAAKVRAYTEWNGKTYYGGWSKLSYTLRQPMCAARPSQNQVYIRWELIPKATGYDVYMCESKFGDYKKMATVNSNKTNMVLIKKWKKKKFKTGHTYYYYVVAKKRVGKETFESVLSYRFPVIIK